ncbi:MAG TPA: hypothetical protein VMG32_04635 [Anaeromyxobacteraceae bacterium]|nr:hypothetical protein [Anaeromyxobacteraceae bacterium]
MKKDAVKKITPRHLRALILAFGLALIGLGLAKALFKVGFSEQTEKTLSSYLFLAAAVACLYLFKLRREEAKDRKRSEEERSSSGFGPSGSDRK